jgi:serine/threonine-protein kinase HipA
MRLLIFNFLSGNGDVHLKNISMLESVDGDMLLSPAYDLMNTKLHIDDSHIALNLFTEMERTKENHFKNMYRYTIKDFIELGSRLGIKVRLLDKIIEQNREKEYDMIKFINRSFLSNKGKQKYQDTVHLHYKQLFA